MARPLRIEYPFAVYHITSRGNEKKNIFLDDKDRISFLDILSKVVKKYNWLCYSYCLMNNHYHIVIETPDGNLSKGMRQLNGVYTQIFNKRHKRIGHLFQGRYKAIIIQKQSHLLEVCRYVILNPVRAQIVNDPADYKWSSYKSTLGLEKKPDFLSIDWLLEQFHSDRNIAINLFKDYLLSGINKGRIYDEIKGQILLGEEDFIKNLIKYTKEKEKNLEIPKTHRFASRPPLEIIFSEEVIKNKDDRNTAIYSAIYDYGYKQIEIARHLKMHYSTISRLINRINK